MLDRNEDGRIEAAELEAVIRSLRIEGITRDEIDRMIQEADIDGNGTVEWDEFLRLMKRYLKRRAQQDEDDEFQEAFTVFDHDGNGFIDREELRLTMQRLGEELSEADVAAMISLADTDGDGRINFEEFKKMMCLRRNGETPDPATVSTGSAHSAAPSFARGNSRENTPANNTTPLKKEKAKRKDSKKQNQKQKPDSSGPGTGTATPTNHKKDAKVK